MISWPSASCPTTRGNDSNFNASSRVTEPISIDLNSDPVRGFGPAFLAAFFAVFLAVAFLVAVAVPPPPVGASSGVAPSSSGVGAGGGVSAGTEFPSSPSSSGSGRISVTYGPKRPSLATIS